MTTSLLNNLLLPSILFEHDSGELEIWLGALPKLPPDADVSSRAKLLTQHVHLLSFLDDCIRRAIRTPYKYIEESLSLVPDYFSPSKPYEMICPVLMTILEQLNAKIIGELISTEAAGVVMCWLKRVMLGLSGKMRDGQFLAAVLRRTGRTLEEARAKGQIRIGLAAVLKGMKSDMMRILGSKGNAEVDGTGR